MLAAVSPRERARDHAITAAFGLRVHAIRKEAGLSQEALAEAAGLHSTFISNIERGYRLPTIATLLRLAKGLGVPPSSLVDGLDHEQ